MAPNGESPNEEPVADADAKGQADEGREAKEEAAVCEWTLWAASRWHLIREQFMDEHVNHAALGGVNVGKFQVGGVARRCMASKDWVRIMGNLGFTGDSLLVFQVIAQTCCVEEQHKQLRAIGVDCSNVITLSQLRRFEGQKNLAGLAKTVRDEGSPSWQFAQLLKRNRQNLLRAWRLDLDTNHSGTVTFVEFSNSLRRMGLQGRVRQIWNSLRPNDDRALEFAELAPDEADHVEQFAELIWNVSGYDLDKAWGLFDYDQKNKMTKADFIQSAEHMGFKGNAELLFKGLDHEGLGWIWRSDFEYIPKVSKVARERLRETEGPLASLVSFSRYEIGGPEVLITKLGLGGIYSEVNVCDLAARLTALGFDGDAQHAAVLAARCLGGNGTKISAQNLLKVLNAHGKPKADQSEEGVSPVLSPARTPALSEQAVSPVLHMRKRSSVNPALAVTRAKPPPAVVQHQPWNSSVVDFVNNNPSKLHPNLRWSFNDFDPVHQKQKQATSNAMKAAAKTSSKFSPPSRMSQSSERSNGNRPSWDCSMPAERADAPKPCRRYFDAGHQKPVRDEVQGMLQMRVATMNAPSPSEGAQKLAMPMATPEVARRNKSVAF